MSKCLLCQKREATIKGSHIIPSFFMKRINSLDGCNERDHELGFSIGLGTVEAYFGRDVYADRRREYTDDERRVEDRTNLDTMDNVFCPECEKLFSKYESSYSQTYLLPFDKALVDNNRINGADAALFWYGVIWRASATEQFGVRLNSGFEEKLRQIVLSENIGGNSLFYSLLYCKDYRSDNPTFALFDFRKDVAMLIVDEFMLVLFNGEKATQSSEELWGMRFECDASELNNGEFSEKIGLMPKQIFGQINNCILHQLINRIDFRGRFDAIHQRLFGYRMPGSIFEEVIAEVQKAKLADMYTIPNYAQSLKRVILAHPNMYRVHFVE